MMNRHPAIVHSNRWATVWQITSSYNSRAMYHSTQFISALCMQACIADHPHANCTQSPRTHELGPKIIEIELWMIGRKWPGVTNQDSWCITSMAERGYADYQQRLWHLDALWGRHRWCYSVGDVFLGHFRPHYPDSTIPDSCQVSEHHCRPGAPIHGNCVPCRIAITSRIMLPESLKEKFEEHDSTFMLMPWPPNSPDMIPIELGSGYPHIPTIYRNWRTCCSLYGTR